MVCSDGFFESIVWPQRLIERRQIIIAALYIRSDNRVIRFVRAGVFPNVIPRRWNMELGLQHAGQIMITRIVWLAMSNSGLNWGMLLLPRSFSLGRFVPLPFLSSSGFGVEWSLPAAVSLERLHLIYPVLSKRLGFIRDEFHNILQRQGLQSLEPGIDFFFHIKRCLRRICAAILQNAAQLEQPNSLQAFEAIVFDFINFFTFLL